MKNQMTNSEGSRSYFKMPLPLFLSIYAWTYKLSCVSLHTNNSIKFSFYSRMIVLMIPNQLSYLCS